MFIGLEYMILGQGIDCIRTSNAAYLFRCRLVVVVVTVVAPSYEPAASGFRVASIADSEISKTVGGAGSTGAR